MRKRWTDEEIQFLKFAYPNKDFTDKEIFEAFENRTKSQIKSKAQKLGLKRYKESIPSGFKMCSRCKMILPLNDFPNNKKSIDGKFCMCNICNRKRYYVYRSLKSTKLAESKKCNVCKKIKPLNEFYKNCNMKDGYLNLCKECKNERRRRRYITGGY